MRTKVMYEAQHGGIGLALLAQQCLLLTKDAKSLKVFRTSLY